MAKDKKVNLNSEDMTSLLLNSTLLSRRALAQGAGLDDGSKDINYACGYPDTLSISHYQGMFDREGLAAKIIKFLPSESWAVQPEVYETEDVDETEFEMVWDDLKRTKQILQYLSRADVLSGIGQYGVLLLGIDDGKELNLPVEGIDDKTGERIRDNDYNLLYLKPFSQSNVSIKEKETDVKSPRFGKPTVYSITFEDVRENISSKQTKSVHWTRLIHLADNRLSSDILGVPRLKDIYNRVLDVRKVLSGSGEMFWKGGFPGYNFEIDPNAASDLDTDTIKEEFQNYSNGLQRYLALTGVKAESLSPQVADPRGHIESHLKYIAIAMDVPYRVFIGTEEAQLASSQDIKNWNKRLAHRQYAYITPHIIEPFINRMIAFGVLPEIEDYTIYWPDLNAPGDKDKAEVAKDRAEAMSKYVAGAVDDLIPPKEFLTMVMGFSNDEAEAVEKAAEQFISGSGNEQEI